MTTFSKVLALFTTAACFAFLGFVAVSLIAGPNWYGETHDFPDYTFEYSGGENPTWSAKRRDNDQAVGGNAVLPKKLVDVLNDIKKDQQARIGLLDNGDPNTRTPGITELDTYLHDPNTGIQALMYKDIAALNQYEDRLEGDFAKLQTAVVETSGEVTELVAKIEGIYIEAERRRGDIYRLENLVAAANTDAYRTVEHQEKLRDVWERYQGVIGRLKERNEILRQQLSERQRRNYEETAAGM